MKLIYLSYIATVAGLALVYVGLAGLVERWRYRRLAAQEARSLATNRDQKIPEEVHAFRDTELGYSMDALQAAELLEKLADSRREEVNGTMAYSGARPATERNER